MLSGIAMLHAEDGYSRCVNLYGFRLFAVSWHQSVWFERWGVSRDRVGVGG